MPAPRPRVADLAYAVRLDGAGEDRVFTTSDAVIVLDGASQSEPSEYDGGWLADTLGRDLAARLADDPVASLPASLAASIAAVRDRYRLPAGSSPSTTVAIIRQTGEAVDALVLGDSPVVALTTDGAVRQLRDGRLSRVARSERHRLRAARRPDERQDARAALTRAERRARNRPGGYWIAEADPAAAFHAMRARWRIDDLAAVLAVTDGVSVGVDRYGVPASWAEAVELAGESPALLVDAVHRAEESDPHRVRWPRGKPHDDKAAAVMRLRP